jgi:anti-sigma-K factor RskA
MYDEDQDALAAEYVLGTLSAEERSHAEASLLINPGFAELVRQWERRLGELNVMVESVEPPADLWDKIKPDIGTVPPSDKIPLVPSDQGASFAKNETETKARTAGGVERSSLLDALASKLLSPSVSVARDAEMKSEDKSSSDWLTAPSVPSAAPTVGTDAFYLARRVRLWRIMALSAGVLVLLLAAFIALAQIAPGLVQSIGVSIPRLFAATPAGAPGSQLVAVLQHEPTSPAFLLTVDPQSRILTVRRVSAKPGSDHSYELWVIPQGSSQALSLGVIGEEQFTQRPLPVSIDPGTMQTASYEVTFEPAGGSKTGAPSGPILFTGTMVQSVPPSQQ